MSATDPFQLFDEWFAEAKAKEINDPDAMALATSTPDGRPSELTRRRWGSFGRSGAALIWGGEAFAVRHDGRANPNQLALGPHSEGDLTGLRTHLLEEHARIHGRTDGLAVRPGILSLSFVMPRTRRGAIDETPSLRFACDEPARRARNARRA